MPANKQPAVVRKLKEQYPHLFTVSELAQYCHRSIDTVNTWRKEGVIKPTKKVKRGNGVYYMYDVDEMERARKFFEQDFVHQGRRSPEQEEELNQWKRRRAS